MWKPVTSIVTVQGWAGLLCKGLMGSITVHNDYVIMVSIQTWRWHKNWEQRNWPSLNGPHKLTGTRRWKGKFTWVWKWSCSNSYSLHLILEDKVTCQQSFRHLADLHTGQEKPETSIQSLISNIMDSAYSSTHKPTIDLVINGTYKLQVQRNEWKHISCTSKSIVCVWQLSLTNYHQWDM